MFKYQLRTTDWLLIGWGNERFPPTQKLVVWVDVSPFPTGAIVRFHNISFRGKEIRLWSYLSWFFPTSDGLKFPWSRPTNLPPKGCLAPPNNNRYNGHFWAKAMVQKTDPASPERLMMRTTKAHQVLAEVRLEWIRWPKKGWEKFHVPTVGVKNGQTHQHLQRGAN